jgi:hypothetical protein
MRFIVKIIGRERRNFFLYNSGAWGLVVMNVILQLISKKRFI